MGLFRLLLAVSVLTQHMHGRSIFGFRLLYGDLAVQCFYMISGFYMALVLHEKYNHPRDYVVFLQQRFLRLYPSYLIILLFYVLVQGGCSLLTHQPTGFAAFWAQYTDVMSWALRALFVFLNLFLIGQDYTFYWSLDPGNGHVVFTTLNTGHLIPAFQFLVVVPSWTLCVEFCFYLIAPFLVRRSVYLQASIVVGFILARWILWAGFHVPSNPWLYRFFPLQFGFFLSGSLGYAIYKRHPAALKKLTASHSWIFWLFFTAVVLYSRLPLSHQIYLVFVPIVFLMIPLVFTATKNSRVDRLIGELSFPFYLGHLLMVFLVDQIAGGRWPRDCYGPAYLALSLAFSYLFFRFVETHTERFRANIFIRKEEDKAAARKSVALTTQALSSRQD
jgi:peptidoglycan/LPS O-acetylase OafA/YrhL